jgi:hypothetical protein
VSPQVLIALTIAFGISLLFGYAIAGSLLVSLPRQYTWTLAPGIGLALCSFIFFLFRRPVLTVESVLVIVTVWYLYRRRKDFANPHSLGRLPAISVILACLMGLAAAELMLNVERGPHGGFDAWGFWNTHARFLVRDGANWRSNIQYSPHSDYPLLTPAIAARFWRFAGHEVPDAGALAGIVLSLTGVTLLAVTLSELRGASFGVLSAVVLLSTPFYLEHSASQYADVPLSFFILATIGLLCLYGERYPDKKVLVLAGFMAGCAGWTKNEGLIFIAVVCAVLMLPMFRTRLKPLQRFLAFSAGLAFPLVTIGIFKATVLGRNYWLEGQSNNVAKIFDLSRHSTILHSYLSQFVSFGNWTFSPLIPLALFVVFHGVDRRVLRSFGWASGVAIVALLFLGYYYVYLVSPNDLQEHLDTSLNRLLLHVWPSILLLAGLLCRAPHVSDKGAAAPQ